MLNKITIIAKDNFFKMGLTELIDHEVNSWPQSKLNIKNILDTSPDLIFIEKEYFECCIFDITEGIPQNSEAYVFIDKRHITHQKELPHCISPERMLDKKMSLTELRSSIHEILLKAIQSNHQKDAIDKYSYCPCFKPLTRAQLRIANYIYSGLGYNSIANRLGVSYKTVLSHKAQIMKKYNVRNKFEFNLRLKSIISAQHNGFFLNKKSHNNLK